jgi:hypothetical protein
VDWTTYIPSVITGIVGVAGISGALWQAKRAREAASQDLNVSLKAASKDLLTGINAENNRAREATKRRIYAESLAAFNEVTIAATAYRVARLNDSEDERREAVARQTKSQEGMYQAIGELMLIAPKKVGGPAITLQGVLVEFMVASHVGQPFQGPNAQAVASVRDSLLRVMRDDLGEPPE